MSATPWLWMRHEVRSTEQRAPIVPEDARRLVEAGLRLTVEESPQRAFGIEDYRAAGAEIVPAGTWVAAPEEVYVLGLKELPEGPRALKHRHIFFGHAYKGQTGAQQLLDRFRRGGGALLDVEYLLDEHGRRLVAFGYWAGYVGAALSVLHHRGQLPAPLVPLRRAELDAALAPVGGIDHGGATRALVVGALGRSGRGAVDALQVAGIKATRWDVAETRDLDKAALLDHDILVNCVVATSPIPPFVTEQDLAVGGRRLAVIGDVTCDVTSDLNVLPVNDDITTWDEPVRRVYPDRQGQRPADVIAIDNLPSLLPVEASTGFSADLLPLLLSLGLDDPVWQRNLQTFHAVASTAEETTGA